MECLASGIVPGSQNKELSLQTAGTGPNGKGTTETLTLYSSKQEPEAAPPDRSPITVRVVKHSVTANNCLPSCVS